MKDILDIIITVMFVFMVAMFVINFNRQQIKKHADKIEENKKKTSLKDEINE